MNVIFNFGFYLGLAIGFFLVGFKTGIVEHTFASGRRKTSLLWVSILCFAGSLSAAYAAWIYRVDLVNITAAYMAIGGLFCGYILVHILYNVARSIFK